MAGPNNDQPNSKVGTTQDADRIWIDSDGFFAPNNTDLTGQQVYDELYLRTQNQIIINSAGALSVINLPSDVGYLKLSITAAASNASAWLTSGHARVGNEIIIQVGGDASVGSVFISTSGVSIVGIKFVDLSSISLLQSATSDGKVVLRSYTDDEWTIVDRNDAVVERVSS